VRGRGEQLEGVGVVVLDESEDESVASVEVVEVVVISSGR
jgi:hypothetical protein